jgi:predicted TIM-barrel fold metal-dependent hydrolase
LWAAVDAGKPIQFHVGYGDTDITMHRCDPTQMTDFLRATMDSGPAITLLHNYPFIREAGFLAQVYPHVYFDTGAVLHFTGPSYLTAVRESLELAPFSKLLFSTDAFGLAEFYACGARLQRSGLARVFGEWLAAGAISADDTRRYLEMIMGGNASRVYGLESR